MKGSRFFLAAVFCLSLHLPAAAQETYLEPLPGVDLEASPALRDGERLFNLHFLDKPADGTLVGEKPGGGLGPFFNRNACSTCHPRGGRGFAPDEPDEPLLTALVRLSVPGKSVDGGPVPHPDYGGQLNTRGIRGVSAEARVEISYEILSGRYGDGTEFELRKPVLAFADAAYGPLDNALTSLRIGQPIFGLGLLEAVSEEVIAAWADPDDRDGDGVSGRMNRVWSRESEQVVLGRFGWKANEPDLVQQSAGAFLGDIGITTPLFPDHDCGATQTACLEKDGQAPELSAASVAAVADYLRTIAAPPRRDRPSAVRGADLFTQTGCAKCHRPSFGVVSSAFSYLNGRRVEAYTDLLLHDMGEGLADGRPDFDAGGREWRTPPLWGLGLVQAVHGRVALLHDGRARSIEEAILWHGGEAEPAQEAFRTLPLKDRKALIYFLNSL